MAEIPPSAFQIPDNALWMIGGWVLTALISTFTGYRWGLKSQQYAELHKSKVAALAEIDRLIAGCEVSGNLRTLLQESQERLGAFIIAVSSQSSCQRHRIRTNKALADYQKIHIGAFPASLESCDSETVSAAREQLSQPLKSLRDYVSATS